MRIVDFFFLFQIKGRARAKYYYLPNKERRVDKRGFSYLKSTQRNSAIYAHTRTRTPLGFLSLSSLFSRGVVDRLPHFMVHARVRVNTYTHTPIYEKDTHKMYHLSSFFLSRQWTHAFSL